MAQRRMLSRRISHSEKINALSIKSQLIYTWQIPYLDDYGCLTGEVSDIKYEIFPRNKNISEEDIVNFIKEAINNGIIHFYRVDGKNYQQYIKFNSFQTFRNDRTKQSDYPKYEKKDSHKPIPTVKNQECDIPTTTSDRHKLSKVKLSKVKLSKSSIADKSAGQEINLLLKEFETINPTINYGNTTQRKTLEEFIKKWGYEKTMNTVRFAVSIQGKKYSPTITTPIQLKNKLGDLLVYHKKESSNLGIVKI